jgi:hypothetical protein
VSWRAKCKKWRAQLVRKGGQSVLHLGWFDEEIDAALAYDKVSIDELFWILVNDSSEGVSSINLLWLFRRCRRRVSWWGRTRR